MIPPDTIIIGGQLAKLGLTDADGNVTEKGKLAAVHILNRAAATLALRAKARATDAGS